MFLFLANHLDGLKFQFLVTVSVFDSLVIVTFCLEKIGVWIVVSSVFVSCKSLRWSGVSVTVSVLIGPSYLDNPL